MNILHEDGIFTIKNFISPDECSYLINESKKIGFEKAMFYDKGRKNNETRINITSQNAPERIKTIYFDMANRIEKYTSVALKAILIHPILEFYMYKKGDYIAKHCDGHADLGNGTLSTLTMVIYLNDDFSGGQTFFSKQNLFVTPSKGDCLFFKQAGLPHTGEEILSGEKYILRTSCSIG